MFPRKKQYTENAKRQIIMFPVWQKEKYLFSWAFGDGVRLKASG